MQHRFAKKIVGNTTRIAPAFVLLAFILNVDTILFSQSSAITGPWSGQAQCQITVQGPYGYNYSETQTWALNGGQPTMQGAMNILPATWSVTGQGSFQKTTGSQTLVGQWKTNASPISAPLALFIRASDGMLILKSWHSQLVAHGSVIGTQQMYINGVAQTPGAISGGASEWQFPFSQVPSNSTSISGSTTVATNGPVGLMQPGGSQGTAACTWNFAAGNSLSAGVSGSAQNPTSSGTGSPNSSGSPGSSTNPGASGSGSGSTSGGGTTTTGSTGGSTPGSGASGGSTPGAGTNPGGTPNSGGQNQPGTGSSGSTNPSAGATTCPATFLPASKGKVTPSCGLQGQQNLVVTVSGGNVNWTSGNFTSSDFGNGVTIVSAVPDPQNFVTFTINISPSAAIGTHNVDVVQQPGTSFLLGGGFSVLPNLVTVPPGVGKRPVPSAPLFGSCPTPPSPVNDIAISNPYCVKQGQQNVAITLTAVSPGQWTPGIYDPNFGGSPGPGVTGVSATWNSANSVTYIVNLDPTAPLGPQGAWIAFAPPNQPCCTILQLGHFITVLPASSPSGVATSPLSSATVTPLSPMQLSMVPSTATSTQPSSGSGQQSSGTQTSSSASGSSTQNQTVSALTMSPPTPTLAGPATVRLNWTAPANPGSTIDFYNIEINSGAGTTQLTFAAPATTATVSSPACPYPNVNCISPGNTVRFRVRAHNSAGYGAYSNYTTPVRPLVSYSADNVQSIWSAKQCTTCHMQGAKLDLSGTAANSYAEIQKAKAVTSPAANSSLLACPSTNAACAGSHPGAQNFSNPSMEYALILQWIQDGAQP